MSKSQRLRLLLKYGYFPVELPPPFHTSTFAKYRRSIAASWKAISNSYPSTVYENYSIPRTTRLRRSLAIVNPVAQLFLSKTISDNWIVIRRHLKGRSFSCEVPEIRLTRNRAVATPDFPLATLRKLEIYSRYDHALLADISRFYGTLYTHAIPWALHDKAWSKANLQKTTFKSSLGNRLDKAIRKCQDNQSVGIPIGPDTSRIISELIAVSIDNEVQEALKANGDQGFRQIDDWCIGFDNLGDAENAVAALSGACRKFELELNSEKTHITHVTDNLDSLWPDELGKFSFGVSPKPQAQSLEHYFARAFHHASQNPHHNVLDFAIKRTWSIEIKEENWRRYEMYLLRAGRVSSMTLPTIVRTLATYSDRNLLVDAKNIAKLMRDVIVKHAPLGHHAEVSWAIFLAKVMNVKLDRKSVLEIAKINSSVCALLALELETLGLVTGKLDKRYWKHSMTSDGLRSNMWLLAYEAEVKGWVAKKGRGYVTADPYFSALLDKGVSFYDPQQGINTIPRIRPKGSHVFAYDDALHSSVGFGR